MDQDPPALDEPDIWASGRETQRAEVQAAFAPRPRTCPHCGHVQTTGGARCEACGGDFVVRRAQVSRRRAALIAGIVVAVAAAAALAIVPGMRDSARDQEQAAAERQAKLEAAERVRLIAESQPRTAAAPPRRDGEDALAYRGRLVSAGEAAVTADALKRLADGELADPVQGTSCSPYPKSFARADQEADPAVPRNRYQCIAYEQKVELSKLQGRERTGIYGVPYWLIIDYSGEPMTFCKISLPPGEGGVPLAKAKIPRACRDPLR